MIRTLITGLSCLIVGIIIMIQIEPDGSLLMSGHKALAVAWVISMIVGFAHIIKFCFADSYLLDEDEDDYGF